MQFQLLLSAILTDKQDSTGMNKLNQLLSKYNDLIRPDRVKSRGKFVKKNEDLLKDMKSFNFKKVKVENNALIQ